MPLGTQKSDQALNPNSIGAQMQLAAIVAADLEDVEKPIAYSDEENRYFIQQSLSYIFSGDLRKHPERIPLTKHGYWFGTRSVTVTDPKYNPHFLTEIAKAKGVDEYDFIEQVKLTNEIVTLTEGFETGTHKKKSRLVTTYPGTSLPIELEAVAFPQYDIEARNNVEYTMYFTLKADVHRTTGELLLKIQTTRPGLNGKKSGYSIITRLPRGSTTKYELKELFTKGDNGWPWLNAALFKIKQLDRKKNSQNLN